MPIDNNEIYMETEMQKETNEIIEILLKKYGSIVLSRNQVSEILNKSVSTLDRWRKKGVYLEYSKIGESNNATIEYSIFDIVQYLESNKIKVN